MGSGLPDARKEEATGGGMDVPVAYAGALADLRGEAVRDATVLAAEKDGAERMVLQADAGGWVRMACRVLHLRQV